MRDPLAGDAQPADSSSARQIAPFLRQIIGHFFPLLTSDRDDDT
jgi:hypothetical protein